MKPLIGITMSRRRAGQSGRRPELAIVPQPYISSVVAAGGIPLALPNVPAIVAEIMPLLSGLLLIGGSDVNPSLYTTGPVHPKTYGLYPERDETEIGLVRMAIARQMPILGICRGLQVLNVALGGSLVQDIPDQWPGALVHDADDETIVRHPIRIEPESRLIQIVGAATVEVNSYHHQAIDRLAPGLTAVAWAPDGVVEAVEGREWPFVLGVQWHPELLSEREGPHAALFQALIMAARRYGRDAPAGEERSAT